jgi:hypothetical protein
VTLRASRSAIVANEPDRRAWHLADATPGLDEAGPRRVGGLARFPAVTASPSADRTPEMLGMRMRNAR